MIRKEYNEFIVGAVQEGYKLEKKVFPRKKTELLKLLCPKGHEFEITMSNFRRGRRCPVCSGKRVTYETSFGFYFPELSEQWSIDMNGDLTPFNVSKSSGKKVWWECNKGHNWQASTANRSSGRGCPYCNGKKVLPVDSLGSKSPKLLIEWNSEKNDELTAYDVTTNSNKKVWWKCDKGHEWKTSIANRFGSKTIKGTNCPYCSGNKMLPENSLYYTHPHLSKEWHPLMNKDVTPYDTTYGSTKKYWWKCNKGHEWLTSCNSRSSGSNCPYCSGKKVNEENSLATIYPELIKEWQIDKNGETTPNNVTVGSDKKVWWMCNNGHEWKAQIKKRTKGQACPFCKIYHGTSFNEQAIYFYIKQIFQDAINREVIRKDGKNMEIDVYLPSINVAIEYDGEQHARPEQIIRDENKNQLMKEEAISLVRIRYMNLPRITAHGAYFICQKKYNDIGNMIVELLKHLSSLQIVQMNNEIIDKILTMDVNVKKDNTKIYESYLRYKEGGKLSEKLILLSSEWHPTMNGTLNINQFTDGSNVQVWWICKKEHFWRATINKRTSGTGCPYCSGKYVTVNNALLEQNPTLAKEWHVEKNMPLLHSEIAVSSNKKVWWICNEGHEWEATVNNRNRLKRGCPYCSGLYPTEKNNLLVVNPELAKEWHPSKNGQLCPKEVKPNSGKKVWWICEEGHEWEAIIQSRNRGNGCNQCRNNKRRKL